MLFCPCSSEWGEVVTDSMGPHLIPPVASPFFLLPCRLSLCLQGAEQEGYHFPSQSRAGFLNGALTVTRGNLRPAAAARRAPSLSVPICAILQSGGKYYLPGGVWREEGALGGEEAVCRFCGCCRKLRAACSSQWGGQALGLKVE